MFCCVQTVWQMIFFHFVACCRCHPSCRKCFGVLALLAVIDYPLNIKDGCTSMKMFARFCELKHSRTLSSFGNALQILRTHARPLYLRFMHCIHSQSASFCFLICVEWLSLYWCYGKRQEKRWNLLSAFSAALQMSDHCSWGKARKRGTQWGELCFQSISLSRCNICCFKMSLNPSSSNQQLC